MIQFTSFGDYGNWVNNKWENSRSEKTISVISPYFDKEIATIPDSNGSDLDIAVDKAKSAFPDWSETNIRDRAQIMFRFKSIIEKDTSNINAYLRLGQVIREGGNAKQALKIHRGLNLRKGLTHYEQMELYKNSGANPLGGCLPMLIQMPILVSVFSIFRSKE